MTTDSDSQTQTVTIVDLADKGKRLGRLPNGMAVFVEGDSVPGDTVEIRIHKSKKNFAEATCLRVIEPSPDRVAPPCPYFKACGGCSNQNLSYAAQLKLKQKRVEDAFVRLAGIADPPISEIIGSSKELGYRNRITFKLGYDKEGQRVAAMHRVGSRELVIIEACMLGSEALNKAMKVVLRNINENQILRSRATSIQLRESSSGRFAAQIIVQEALPDGSHFPQSWPAQFEAVSLAQERAPHRVHLVGNGVIDEEIVGYRFQLPLDGFFQVNTEQCGNMIQWMEKKIGTSAEDARSLDLFCGCATFSLPLAKAGYRVMALEGNKAAVKSASVNAKLNKLKVNAHMQDLRKGFYYQGGAPEWVVVDPPRNGVHEPCMESLIKTAAKNILYISCDPATLARDSKLLAEAGWKLIEVQPMDLFPQTDHVEVLTHWSRG